MVRHNRQQLLILEAIISGVLYIVATPIGNLQDFSARAINTLSNVDYIAAEDTRHSAYLMRHYNIGTPMIALHEHNEQQRISALLNDLQQGKQIALISDAGTPLISDPGYRLVAAAHAAELTVTPIPGPCALISALCAAGLPTDRFLFVGFAPARGEARRHFLEQHCLYPHTVVLYESPHRIVDLMQQLLAILAPERQIAVAREMSKKFETIRLGPVRDIAPWIINHPHQQKGEFVVLIEGAPPQQNDLEMRRLLSILLKELPLKQAVALATQIAAGNKNQLYQLALQLKEEL